MESRWVVKKDGKAIAGGPISTIAPDDLVRQMYAAGYKTYIDGKIYKPKRGETDAKKTD